jgi:predicted Zn finger-like uncharacterized protein
MILTCPECSTRYQAKDAAFLPSGRRVRCAKCGHSWHQDPPVAEAEAETLPPPQPEAPAPEPVPEPAPEAAREPGPSSEPQAQPEPAGPGADVPPAEAGTETAEPVAAKPNQMKEQLALAGGWIGLVAVVLVIGWAAVSYREQVATLWPQSATFYSTLGLPVNARGISFADVRYRREIEDKEAVLAVTGTLVNLTDRELAVPPIRVTLTGEDGHELYHWSFAPDVSVLRAGQRAGFRTRLSSPPAAVRHLTLQFAGSKG